jgi:Protein of unknown function (DUF3667)
MIRITLPTQATGLCASCSLPLSGRFCSHCGEEAHDPKSLTVGHFVTHTMAHEMLHLDGKVWRTLRLLFLEPGRLAAEYAAGRRRPYVNPVRIFLIAIVAYALLTRSGMNASLFIGPVVLSVAPAAAPKGSSVAQTVERIDRYGLLARMLAEKQRTRDLNSDAARERFQARLESFAEPLSFTNVVLLSTALYVMFRRRRQLFVEHGVFSLHFMSVVLLSTPLILPGLRLLDTPYEWLALAVVLLMLVWQFTYLGVAIRRFYLGDDTRRVWPAFKAAGAAMLVYVVNSAFITLSQILGGALALASL